MLNFTSIVTSPLVGCPLILLNKIQTDRVANSYSYSHCNIEHNDKFYQIYFCSHEYFLLLDNQPKKHSNIKLS